jgi:hypothetical protein
MSPFQYEYAKLGANICGSGMNAELRMTCRGRASILGPPQLCTQASGFLVLGHFLRRWPYGRESGAMVICQIETSGSPRTAAAKCRASAPK